MKNFERITVDPAQMGGVPCVRHLRIPVATVLRLLAGGLAEAEILAEYPDLQIEDIRECLRFAAASAMERELPLPHSALDSLSITHSRPGWPIFFALRVTMLRTYGILACRRPPMT